MHGSCRKPGGLLHAGWLLLHQFSLTVHAALTGQLHHTWSGEAGHPPLGGSAAAVPGSGRGGTPAEAWRGYRRK